jgi:hypothetical protein
MDDKRLNVLTSFNADFRVRLEYRLSEAFAKLDDNGLSCFWCDGIYEPLINEHFTHKNITSINTLSTWAWIGPMAQDQYVMTIKLGRRCRRRALKGLDLSCCLLDANSFDWVDIDVKNKTITIELS